MEKALLFGNGINLINSSLDWKKLLKTLKGNQSFDIGDVPYSLIYERIVLEKTKKNLIKNQADKNIRDEIVSIMRKTLSNDIYIELFSLNISHYITTNYDYAFQQSIKNHIDIEIKKDSTEQLYSIRRSNQVLKDNNYVCKIWFLHGEIDVPNSIMLGYDMYCKSISKIDSYLKGDYKYQKDGKSVELKRSILDKIKAKNNPIDSWIDLFFLYDVHILGLSLKYEEIDLWWLLNYRAKLIQDGRKIKNRIFFYTQNRDPNLHGLLEAFHVEVVLDADFEDGKWEDHYRRMIAKI